MKKLLTFILVFISLLLLVGCDVDNDIVNRSTCDATEEYCILVGHEAVNRGTYFSYVDLRNYYTQEQVDERFNEMTLYIEELESRLEALENE